MTGRAPLELPSCRYRLEQMPFMEFYQGLRERNWTSPWYKEDAAPWRVQFFQDSGRFMAPSYPGYRSATMPAIASTVYPRQQANPMGKA